MAEETPQVDAFFRQIRGVGTNSVSATLKKIIVFINTTFAKQPTNIK
jgi:hypothetical protein